MQDHNKWNVPYSVISFFERALSGHSKVSDWKRVDDIHFVVEHVSGDTFHVLLVNEYSIGLAAVLRAQAEFPGIEYVVTGGAWNGYTPEAKDYGRQNGVGIFNSSEFFGALNWTDPKGYVRGDDDGNPVYAYKNS